MKTKFYVLLASAALIAQANAGGHHGGGGGTFGGPSAPARAPAPSFHSAPMQHFGSSRIYSGQRFSPGGPRGSINRGDGTARLSNGKNHAIVSPRREGNGARQVRSANNLPTNWRNHVVAQHSGNWQRNWDRHHDHWWHRHHCRFVNGSWFVFDFGFDPWWPDWYPYDYYAYDYYPYPYGYGPGDYYPAVYQGEQDYGNTDQSAGSTVVAVQERLEQQGYYRGDIDGIFGPSTRRAIIRYQGAHGLRVTGLLTTDTLHALGLSRS